MTAPSSVYRLVLIGLALFAGLTALGQDNATDYRKEAARSLKSGAAFLISHQDEDGGWGNAGQPAIAALGAMALHDSPTGDRAASTAAVDKAMTYVLSYVQDDGAIYNAAVSRGAYPNYNTAICLLALSVMPKDEYLPVIRAARQYLMAAQVNDPDSIQHGGFSYGAGPRGGRPDLSNGSWVAEAMYYSELLVQEKPGASPKTATQSAEMWDKLRVFLEHSQKLTPQDQANLDQAGTDVGGFAYLPGENVSELVTTGSMTYAGLKTMIYARLKPDDARVQGVLHYLRGNYTMDENPGAGMNGYYYYLLMLAKGLDASGQQTIVTTDGTTHDWRRDVTEKLISLQGEDGSWINDKGRFFESMPELVTAYAMITMRTALQESTHP